jgi:hypothetical protein
MTVSTMGLIKRTPRRRERLGDRGKIFAPLMRLSTTAANFMQARKILTQRVSFRQLENGPLFEEVRVILGAFHGAINDFMPPSQKCHLWEVKSSKFLGFKRSMAITIGTSANNPLISSLVTEKGIMDVNGMPEYLKVTVDRSGKLKQEERDGYFNYCRLLKTLNEVKEGQVNKTGDGIFIAKTGRSLQKWRRLLPGIDTPPHINHNMWPLRYKHGKKQGEGELDFNKTALDTVRFAIDIYKTLTLPKLFYPDPTLGKVPIVLSGPLIPAENQGEFWLAFKKRIQASQIFAPTEEPSALRPVDRAVHPSIFGFPKQKAA